MVFRRLFMKFRKLTAIICTLAMFFTLNIPVKADDTAAGTSSSNVPIYRLYNPNSSEHFYTADSDERVNLIKEGWNDEGIGFYETASGTPVYRLYNANGGEHHYTSSTEEKEMLVDAGWNDEDIAFYSSGSVPIYRQYNPNAIANNHNYTTSTSERDSLVSAGWNDEDISFYATGEGDPDDRAQLYSYTVTYYQQNDSQWADKRYGLTTLGTYGCVPTAMAMCLQAVLGTTVTPVMTADYLYSIGLFNGAFKGTSGELGAIACAEHWGVSCDNCPDYTSLRYALEEGKLVSICVDGDTDSPFTARGYSHNLVLQGYEDGQTMVYDPATPSNNVMTDLTYIWSYVTQDPLNKPSGNEDAYAIYK